MYQLVNELDRRRIDSNYQRDNQVMLLQLPSISTTKDYFMEA